jgi:tetratricopeptide (TPR) repeat protein
MHLIKYIQTFSFWLLLIFISNTAFSQDSNYINQLNKSQFQKVIQQSDPFIKDSLQQTQLMAKKISFKKGEAEALKNLGVYYFYKKSLDTAQNYYKEALAILKNSPINDVTISLHTNMGFLFFEKGNYKASISEYLIARNEAISLNDSVRMVRVLNNLANTETTIGDNEQAKKTLDEALKWMPYNNPILTNILSAQASLYKKTGDTTKAIATYIRLLPLLQNNANPKLKANTLFNYGNLLYEIGKLEKSAALHNESLIIYQQINDKEGILSVLNAKANIFFKKEAFEKARMLYEEIAAQADDNLLLKRTIYTNLNIIYERMGNYKKAHEALSILSVIKDSVTGAEIRKAIDVLKTENAVQQAEMKTEQIAFKAEKEKLTLSKKIAWLTIGLILALCIAGIFVYLRQRQQWKAEKQTIENLRQKSELEIQLFRTQMNPHFFFNALYSIQNYILHNNVLESSRYLGKFARLARAILEWNEQPFVAITKEISILEDYLSLEQLRFENRFSFTIICEEEVAAEFAIPTMIVQPFVENAIIHGLSNCSYEGLITITIETIEAEALLKVSINDNGIGIQESAKKEKKDSYKKSMALQLTQKRLNLLSAQYSKKYFFELIDKKQNNSFETGTLVNLYLPLIEA